jgi:predicted ester cyclase
MDRHSPKSNRQMEVQKMQLTPETARSIVMPLYEALNEPAKKDVRALLERATTLDFQSCGNDGECVGRDAVIARFTALGYTVPNLRWTIKEIFVAGQEVIVRGEATGTPVQAFLGLERTGKSFRTMSIDIHAIENEKIKRSYHVENWTVALRQLREK